MSMTTLNGRLNAWIEKDNNRLGLWLIEPKASLAYAINGVGMSLLRLSGRFHPDPIADVWEYGSEEFAAGYRSGWRSGQRNAAELSALVGTAPTPGNDGQQHAAVAS